MESYTRLYLIRHAEVEEKYHRVFGGRIDMGLSPRGHEQALALANYLRTKALDAIYASPMKRVQQTLAPLAEKHPVTPVHHPDLREVDFGVWTGLHWSEVAHQYQVNTFGWLESLENDAIPQAESAREFRARVDACLEHLFKTYPEKTIAIFCHGGVIRAMLARLLDLPLRKMAGFEIEYGSLTRVHWHPRKTELDLMNFTPWRDVE